jgi:hypothetical protein
MSSWADIAAKNAPPEELQAHPDPSLLEKQEDHPSHSGEQAVDYEAEHVHGMSNLFLPLRTDLLVRKGKTGEGNWNDRHRQFPSLVFTSFSLSRPLFECKPDISFC